jgi:centrosomal protein CEP76
MERLAADFVKGLDGTKSAGDAEYKAEQGSSSSSSNVKEGLRVQVVSAKGLAMPLESREELQGLEVSVLFQKKHFRSDSVLCTTTDPILDFESEFSISKHNLIVDDSLIMVYLSIAPTRSTDQVKCGINGCCRTLISCAAIDPRLVCVYGGEYINVELIPCENDGISTIENGEGGAGSLFVRLHMLEDGQITKFNNDSTLTKYGHLDWSVEKIEESMATYQDRISKTHQDNFQLARSWFSRARREYPFLEDRRIRLVAEDECGRHRFVCGFVSPNVHCPRSVDGPRFAARFVSLIPFKRDVSLSGERVSTWHSAQCTSVRLQGDVEDHALLLCSLLLSWGMDAWVCYGTIYDADHQGNGGADGAGNSNPVSRQFRPHYWVATLDDLHEGRMVFWESLTGQQYNVSVDSHLRVAPQNVAASGDAHPGEGHPFREIYSMFRHDAFLLNLQRFSLLSAQALENKTVFTPVAAIFNLNDSRAWLPFPFKDDKEVSLLRHPGSELYLSDARSFQENINIAACEERLEAQLKDMLVAWRAENGLQTHFDDELSTILQPALAAYEMDRATGVTFGNQDFQAAVKNKVQKGETFKAYPTCFGHTDPLAISSALKLTHVVKDIVTSRSENRASSVVPEATRLALRVRIFSYPEGTCACWVMVAAAQYTAGY